MLNNYKVMSKNPFLGNRSGDPRKTDKNTLGERLLLEDRLGPKKEENLKQKEKVTVGLKKKK